MQEKIIGHEAVESACEQKNTTSPTGGMADHYVNISIG
jgi:hypothetical protein